MSREFWARHPSGRVQNQEQTVEDVVEELFEAEEAIEVAIDPHGGAVVYSLHFDEEVVNDWLEEQALQFTT